MVFKVFVDGQEGIIGFCLFDYLLQCDDIELLCIVDDKCKDFVECVKFLNVVDIVFLCLLDVVLCEVVLLVNNLNICIIDVSIVFCMLDDWVYGLLELVQGQCECLCNIKWIVVLGCYVSVFVLLMCLLVDVGIVLVDYLVIVFLFIGYSGGGKQMIVDYLVVNNLKFDSLCLYVLVLGYKYLLEMCVQSWLSFVLIFMLVVGNFFKGLVVMIGLYLQYLVCKVSLMDIVCVLVDYYQGEQFICVVFVDNVVMFDNGFFDVQGVNDINCVDLFVFGLDECMVVIVCLDNLGKGVVGVVV